MIRNLYVCMGEAGTTDTEAWVSQAKIAMQTDTTAATSTRPTSAMAQVFHRPISARPVSARSIPSSGLRLDSGIWSPNKTTSIYGSGVDDITQYTQSMLGMGEDQDDIPLGGDLFDPSLKQSPSMPRPSDDVCAVSSLKTPGLVYTKPHPPQKTKAPTSQTLEASETEQEDQGIGDDSSISTESSIPSVKELQPPKQELVFKDLDQFGNVIVGSALKNALSEITGQSASALTHNSEFLHPMFEESEKFLGWDRDSVECVIREPTHTDEAGEPTESVEVAESVVESSHTIIGDKDSDEDSVLNSDEDYEDERDDFFRKSKGKVSVMSFYYLSSGA